MNPKDRIKIILSFIVLFALYHAAEYMIMFKNNATGFFIFQLLFFVSAFLFGNWYSREGLAAWGLPFSIKMLKPFLLGMVLGILLYGISYCTSVLSGIETIIKVPGVGDIMKSSLAFTVGVLFSSLSEDVLTRGIMYRYFNHKIKPAPLVFLSASVYLLNHIYRLTDGIETLLYIFLLGIVFIIPVIYTKNLWLTGGMHWAGNVFFFVSHNVIGTEEHSGILSPNAVFIICLIVFIPFIWLLSNKLYGDPKPSFK